MSDRSNRESGGRLWPRERMSEGEKWRAIIDNSLRSMCLGFICAGGASLLALRSLTPRIAVSAFGTGVGLGISYVDAKYILGHDVDVVEIWRGTVKPSIDETVCQPAEKK